MSRRARGHRRERRGAACDDGSATIWCLTAAALVLVITYAGLLLAAVAQARQRAAAAADLAALAAASTSTGDPCTVATRSATANGAQLVACTVSGSLSASDVRVRTSLPLPGALAAFGARTITVSARAGPA